MATKICPVCGNEFGRNKPTNYVANRTYCSRKCSAVIKNKSDPSKRVVLNCTVCGKSYEEWAYRNSKCCSKKCASKLSKGVPKPSLLKPDHFVTVCCEQCGKEYVVHKCMTELRNSRFCSRKCKGEYHSLHMQGVNHPRFIGGARYATRGSNWYKQRKLTLQRDGFTCQICHKAKRVDVHHIKPYKDFGGDYLVANVLTNLITLCRQCHAQVEHHEKPCPKRLF